jgi:2-polyprenyl-3-methyl-5-hydroxy-6-metoxy-1,4-benzoquinol methylase
MHAVRKLADGEDRRLSSRSFAEAQAAMPVATARLIVERALQTWDAPDAITALQRRDKMNKLFPDGAPVESYWHERAGTPFTQFFAWGHDHDFGHDIVRRGAMGARHKEITAESIAMELLPFELKGRHVLDIGCWTGGDALVLAGLGATVTALEEHPVSAAAARHLTAQLGCPVEVLHGSLYADRRQWQGKFDIVYCSGVLYHVTDPLLFLRICFAYLKPGGRLVIETKADGAEGSLCSYAGTTEKGWNWFAPTREAMGRLLADAGFPMDEITLHWRPIGRLLAGATKGGLAKLPESAGFSRPGSWLAGTV